MPADISAALQTLQTGGAVQVSGEVPPGTVVRRARPARPGGETNSVPMSIQLSAPPSNPNPGP